MQMPVCAHGVTAVDAGSAVPVGEPAAAFLKNRHERRAIPGVHHGIEHHVGAPGGDQAVAIAVAPPALEQRRLLKRVPSGAQPPREQAAVGVDDRRLGQRRTSS